MNSFHSNHAHLKKNKNNTSIHPYTVEADGTLEVEVERDSRQSVTPERFDGSEEDVDDEEERREGPLLLRHGVIIRGEGAWWTGQRVREVSTSLISSSSLPCNHCRRLGRTGRVKVKDGGRGR